MDNIFKEKAIALFFGGRSPEHEVSINSAKTVFPILQNLFKKVYLIYVNKRGDFFLLTPKVDFKFDYDHINNEKILINLSIIPNKGISFSNNIICIDLAFIAIHGNEGEDGKLQGLFDISNIKYTGCNSTSSGICMYKELSRQIVANNNVRTIETIIQEKESAIVPLKEAQKKLSSNLFIKSETTGSSIGITSLINPTNEEYISAINNGFKYSDRVLIQPLFEDFLEVEVAMLEKENTLIASDVGVVIKYNMKDTLTFDSKYGEVNSATIDPKYDLDKKIKKQIKENAITIFKALNLSGFSRIDFFLYKNKIYFNEVNTIPGLTSNSHYPILINNMNISLTEAIYHICKKAYEK